MLHLEEEQLTEEEALTVIADLIDAIDREGLGAVCSSDGCPRTSASTRPSEAMVSAALSSCASLSTSTAVMMADALVEKAFEAFQPTLRRFQKDLRGAGSCSSGGKGVSLTEHSKILQSFLLLFVSVRGALMAWGKSLRMPEVASAFTRHVRCAFMQPDVLSGEMPLGRREFVSFLSSYGRKLLRVENVGGAKEEEEEDGEGEGAVGAGAGYAAALRQDPVLRCLDELGLSETREMKQLWHEVLVQCIADNVCALDEGYTERVIQDYLTWEEDVVEPFVHATLSRYDDVADAGLSSGSVTAPQRSAAPRIEMGARPQHRRGGEAAEEEASGAEEGKGAEKDRWCTELRERLLVAFARKRIASFWDIMAEYPDSVPALEDLRYCLQSCPRSGIKEELTDRLRALFSTRLHRAGTRTEDILVMLSKAVNSLWVLVPRNEQNAVILSVVSETLSHLWRRKDCIPAVVQVLTQPGGDAAAQPQAYSDEEADGGASSGAGERLDDGYGSPLPGRDREEDAEGGMHSGGRQEQPDVLRILLAAIPVRALTEEYQHALAQQLLAKDPHDFDTTAEEEVLERLKCVLGGDVMPDCEVMVHDIRSSKRTTNQLRERLAQAIAGAGLLPPQAVSLDVLSLTAWPKLSHCLPAGETVLPPDSYTCHPALQREMDRLAEGYKHLKQGQKLSWLLSQGRVALDVRQYRANGSDELVTTPYTLSLFAASLLLFMRELERQDGGTSGVALETLAAKLGISVTTLQPHLPHLIPSLLVWCDGGPGPESSGGGGGGGERIRVQRVLPAPSHVLFDEAGKQPEVGDGRQAKSSLDEEQMSLLRTMVVAMLQNGGAASAGDVMNSLKMFTGISLTNTDMKQLMHPLIAEGSVVQTDSKLYSIP